MRRVLFDQGVPLPLRQFLSEHEVQTCYSLGWSSLSNGELINQAEQSFDVFVTTDKNLRYQQNLTRRKIAILVLPTTRWPVLKPHGPGIAEAIERLEGAGFMEWSLPD